mmetsp:Transcript_95987/g.200494  ORF Transcript_95987/g.200494 Transcript_95987/m.200494 type:complete len:187 (+) Transcript_95987:168-728(+)
MAAKATTKALAPDVLQRLREQLEDEDFLKEVACWAWVHCPKFPHEDPSRWEHPLEFTRLHGEYRELFENRCDEFLEQEGVDMKAILDQVAVELEENPGEMRALVDSLAASEDYMKFCRFMQQIRTRRDWAEGKDLQASEDDEVEQEPIVIISESEGDERDTSSPRPSAGKSHGDEEDRPDVTVILE